MKKLFKVLNDHKNPMMQELVNSSYEHCFRDEMHRVLGEGDLMDSQDCGTEEVTKVWLINSNFNFTLQLSITKLRDAKLEMDTSGSQEDNIQSIDEIARLSDKLTVLVNDIGIAMKKMEYALFRGKMDKKLPTALYTYADECAVRAFVNSLAANQCFKARLLKDMKKIIDILSDPDCEVIRPISIDYNLIEVNGGHCWSIKERRFAEDPIPHEKIGTVSPGAFAKYDPNTEPEPTYFKEILENSLSEMEIGEFCEDFLKLLNFNKKCHKDKVPYLVGAADSSKTSLFFLIQGLVHHGNITTVTKQCTFNKPMITPYTEMIFIDEADENVLNISDWKILTQGGYTAHDIKYQTAKAFMNRCLMLVTAQRKLDFGPTHQPAMDRCLWTYHFTSLPNPKKKAATWLRRHAMECVEWAAEKANDREDEEGDTASDDECTLDSMGDTLKEEEKDAMRLLLLSSPLAQETEVVAHTSDEESPGESPESAGPANDALVALRESLASTRPDGLMHRQLKHMLHEEERRQLELSDHIKRQHQAQKTALREKGVCTQSAELLPKNPDAAMATLIQRELQHYIDDQGSRQERERHERACKAFEGHWLRSMEKELHECVQSVFFLPPFPVRRKSLVAYREVLEDKLRNHHRNLGMLGSSEALQERRQVCISLGLLQNRHQHLVKSVCQAVPTTEELCGKSSASEEEDSEQGCVSAGQGDQPGKHDCGAKEATEHDDDNNLMSITLAPSWQTSLSVFERTRKAMASQARPKVARKRSRSPRGQLKRTKVTR